MLFSYCTINNNTNEKRQIRDIANKQDKLSLQNMCYPQSISFQQQGSEPNNLL